MKGCQIAFLTVIYWSPQSSSMACHLLLLYLIPSRMKYLGRPSPIANLIEMLWILELAWTQLSFSPYRLKHVVQWTTAMCALVHPEYSKD